VVAVDAVTEGLPYCVHRLSWLPEAEHRAIKVDRRFLQLVGLTALKLKSRPKELRDREIANILNGMV
jgi:hypothetical protein